MKGSYGIAAALVILAAAALPGGVAKAATPRVIQSNSAVFDARADGAASSYCIDAPAVLIGQQICGGFLRSTVTATSDPRGFALGGLAPAPKLSSVPLLIPNNVQGIPVPEQVQRGLKQIRFNNVPSQCQAAFPPLNQGDDDQTCGGPTYGDSALGFIGSGANARVLSTGDATNPTQTRTSADSRASYANLTGLQSTFDNVRSLSESGLGSNGDPTGSARMNAGRVTVAGGLLTVDGIVSATTVAFNGTKSGTAANTSFKYAGAALAGIPVEITPEGLVLATDQVPADQAAAFTKQLNTILENNNGFGVKLLPAPPIEVTPSLARASSGGILVTYRGSTGTDVTYSQMIGNTWAQVGAVAASGAGAGTADSSAASRIPGASTGTAGVGAGLVGPATGDLGANSAFGGGGTPTEGVSAGSDPTLGTDTTAAGPVTQSLRMVGDQAQLAGFRSAQSLSSSRVQDIYPIFCLLLLASLAAARLRRRPLSTQAA
jgi:hypothetical protein